mmetsp:Transcript_12027/g.27953  ORF Transcript_12027/g.27953 Transcript_12027/m.27953 type:complete len:169 (-) Transcript_12027:298-804(-)
MNVICGKFILFWNHLAQADGGNLRLWSCPTPDCPNRRIVPANFDPKTLASSGFLAPSSGRRGGLLAWLTGVRAGAAEEDEDEATGSERGSDSGRVIWCEACEKKICVPCSVEEHTGISCEAFAKWKEENDAAEASFKEMMAGDSPIIKPCPNCQVTGGPPGAMLIPRR